MKRPWLLAACLAVAGMAASDQHPSAKQRPAADQQRPPIGAQRPGAGEGEAAGAAWCPVSVDNVKAVWDTWGCAGAFPLNRSWVCSVPSGTTFQFDTYCDIGPIVPVGSWVVDKTAETITFTYFHPIFGPEPPIVIGCSGAALYCETVFRLFGGGAC